ncbi:sensor histidine kinase [Anaerocolumna sedimenticola]|uniref:histidine kinase n=1 Tax=Anaerocolumna sedimenticola TaxID=2696063 RepID=A0A6P1TM74_9FIRM|nr:HAMP domain-containing sensor histidine kinase [Anaerocolumna sedimenticola]QHQ60956.1 sensor histidine kinase [Anaerocolumna sedimenticola]
MDTKLKNNDLSKVLGIFISLLLLTAISIGVIASYPIILQNANSIMDRSNEEDKKIKSGMENSYQEEFLKDLYRGNYCLYWDTMEQVKGNVLTPGEVLIPGSINWVQPKNTEYSEEYANQTSTQVEGEFDNNYYDKEFVQNINSILQNWHNSFFDNSLASYSLEYYIIDNKTGKTLTNTVTNLNILQENSEEAQKIKALYPFYGVFRYKEDGSLEIPELYGLEESRKDSFKTLELTKELFSNELYNSSRYQYFNQIKSPADVTIIYASKDKEFYYPGGVNYDNQWRQIWSFRNGGFLYVYAISLILVTLLALLLPFKKSFGLEKSLVGKVPLEIGFLGICFVFGIYRDLSSVAYETISDHYLDFSEYTIFPYWMQRIMDYGANFLIFLLIFMILFSVVLSVRNVFSLGLKSYFKERTLTGILLVWIKRNGKRLIAYLSDIDLTDSSNKAIFKILAVNFIILTLLCSIWFLGIAVLIPYTIILFFVMRKIVTDIKAKYAKLLNATSSMAEGNLEVSIEEDLGVFNPLKEELAKVQFGFKKAVEQEMKSQKMKTDLITNVSHDLKTPLTAIITYVNLLKERNITEEERASYIETLDKKSLRLKSLIEDLFEISKASSNNVVLNLVDMDLVSLIKQVQFELSEKIEQSEVEFRFLLPEEKVILKLDSDKTFRIFENLMLNITKYAMPHTRAYIEIQSSGKEVTVTLKNISASELDFNSQDITERFVRGDKSRNTEGSGLGLAIVKNFVEVQGGKFKIHLDGDLFKAVIIWKK